MREQRFRLIAFIVLQTWSRRIVLVPRIAFWKSETGEVLYSRSNLQRRSVV
jgi:hypothetical protein